jgi:hypothetical protein
VKLNTNLEMLSKEDFHKQTDIAAQLGTSVESLKGSGVRETYVEALHGDVTSHNCGLSYNVTVEGFRINWSDASDAAVFYSVVMTAICLTQIVLLLKQLHHSQHNSNVARVSMATVGAQAVVDAVITLWHLLMSVVSGDMFSIFISIILFKILGFGVILFKYVCIINEAWEAGGGVSWGAEEQRREVTRIHVRFYCGMMGLLGVTLVFFDHIYFIIFLAYSYWIPQIVLNVTTECRKPMNVSYIVGTGVTRMWIIVYVLGYSGNFLKVAFPKLNTHPTLAFCMVVWQAMQVGVLVAQNKYGARFMIPERFLPPKFDYERDVPSSMSGGSGDGGGMGGATIVALPSDDIESGPSAVEELECVICYDAVEVTMRDYMLAPCEHIFHKDCLMKWMDVKMECPVCRGPLPEL